MKRRYLPLLLMQKIKSKTMHSVKDLLLSSIIMIKLARLLFLNVHNIVLIPKTEEKHPLRRESESILRFRLMSVRFDFALTVPGNTKLALGVCHPPDAVSQMSRFTNFTPPINNVIPPRTMNHTGAAVDNRINDALHALSEDLYPSITAAARDFDVPTRTLQRRINRMGPLSSRLPNNKALSDAQEQAVYEYIKRLD